jgi:hypothetical protein
MHGSLNLGRNHEDIFWLAVLLPCHLSVSPAGVMKISLP